MNVFSINHNLDRILKFNVQTSCHTVRTSATRHVTRYEFDESNEINIVKDNPWLPHNKINRLFMMLYSLDLYMGNAFDCDNLPFSINYCVDSSGIVSLGDIAVSDSKSIQCWSTAVKTQISITTGIILLTGFFLTITSSFGFLFGIAAIILLFIYLKHSIMLLATTVNEFNKFVK